MSVRERDNPALFAKVQAQNLLRQYDLLTNCIEIGLEKGIESFDKYTLWALNYAAVANIAQFGGRYREEFSELEARVLAGCVRRSARGALPRLRGRFLGARAP